MPSPRNLSGAMTGCKQALPASLGRQSELQRRKRPGLAARAFSCALMHYCPSKSLLRALLSSHGVEGARYLLLDRLRRVGGDLGGQRSDFGSLTRGIERPLERIDRLFQSLLAALIGFASLGHRRLRESTHALRHRCIKLERLELFGSSTERIARLLGGNLGGICLAHNKPPRRLVSPGGCGPSPFAHRQARDYCYAALQYKWCAAKAQGPQWLREHFFRPGARSSCFRPMQSTGFA